MASRLLLRQLRSRAAVPNSCLGALGSSYPSRFTEAFVRGEQSTTLPDALPTNRHFLRQFHATRHPLSSQASDKAEDSSADEKDAQTGKDATDKKAGEEVTENGDEKKAADADENKAAEDSPDEAKKEEAPKTKEEKLEEEVATLKDHLLRSIAEQENTRKIAARDVESARQFAIKAFAKSLLDVSDNLTRAMDSVPEESRKDQNNPVLSTLFEGIEMTDKGLMKAFEKNGLERFGEVGEVFDPNKHEALFEYADAEKKPGTVGQVMKPGFFLHKRVLRPAEVGVVKQG